MRRVLVNFLIFISEIAAIIAVAYFAYLQPLWFAGVTAAVVLAIGSTLEFKRLAHELPFYTGRSSAVRKVLVGLVSLATTLAKALVAGLVALMTFSGTDPSRQEVIVIVFGVSLFVGTSLLRRLALSFHVFPMRWGYFRLALPLGLAFAAGLWAATRFGFITTPSATEITRRIFVETPPKPSIAEASELLFQLKQYIDSVLLTLLRTVLPPEAADVASVVISANVLVGMVLAVYAVVIAEAVRRAEHNN